MSNEKQSLLSFPCDFPLKVFGLQSDTFQKTVLQAVNELIPNTTENAVQTRPSKDGKYLAVTVLIQVDSQEQLDAVYRALTAHPEVLMVL